MKSHEENGRYQGLEKNVAYDLLSGGTLGTVNGVVIEKQFYSKLDRGKGHTVRYSAGHKASVRGR